MEKSEGKKDGRSVRGRKRATIPPSPGMCEQYAECPAYITAHSVQHLKIGILRNREMGQRVGIRTVLAKDPILIPSSCVR